MHRIIARMFSPATWALGATLLVAPDEPTPPSLPPAPTASVPDPEPSVPPPPAEVAAPSVPAPESSRSDAPSADEPPPTPLASAPPDPEPAVVIQRPDVLMPEPPVTELPSERRRRQAANATRRPVPPPPALPSPEPPEPVSPYVTMAQYRRDSNLLLVVAAGAFAGAVATRWYELATWDRCRTASHCDESAFARLDGFVSLVNGSLHATTVGIVWAAAAMRGRARATRDVFIDRHIRERSPLAFAGIGVATVGAAGYFAAYARYSRAVDPVPEHRWANIGRRAVVVNAATLVIAGGAAMAGYAIAYERHTRALDRLLFTPSVGSRHAGVAVSGRF